MTEKMLTQKEFRNCFPKIAKYLQKSELDIMLNSLEACEFDAGEPVTRDGELADALYFVVDGTLDCYLEKNSDRFQLGTITKGQYVGEVTIMDRGTTSATVIAATGVRLLKMTQEKFQQLRADEPRLASILLHAFCEMLIERVRSSDELLLKTLLKLEHDRDISDIGNIRKMFSEVYQQLHGYE